MIMLVRNGILIEFDERTIHEMKYFFVSESGKREASVGEHDDAVMTTAICCLSITE
jgi:hypothetical protein